MTATAKELVQKISKIIYEKKGINTLALYVGGFSTVTDFLMIAEGNVDRHVIAIAQEIVKELRDREGIRPNLVEGLHVGDWVLLDYSDIIIHLFRPDLRGKYQLEQLWSKGELVDLSGTVAS